MRNIICISLMAASPVAADGLGCFATERLEDRPVSALSLYVFHNASRQGRYATIRAEAAGEPAEVLAPCPTDFACIAPAEGGSLAISETSSGIEVITDRFAFGGLDLGNGSPVPERYALARMAADACGGPA